MSKKILITLISIASVAFLLFTAIAIQIATNGVNPFAIDTNIANWAYSVRGEKGGFTFWFFRIVTEFGYTYFTVGIIVIIAVALKFKPKALFIAITVAISWALHKIIKAIIVRPRPDSAFWWMTETSSSFPSGHSNTATCLAVLIIYFVLTSPVFKTWIKYLIATLSCCIIALVPLSRIIMGVHWFTDVIGGMLLGAFCAVLGILAYQIFLDRKNKKIQKEINTAKEKSGIKV